MWRFILSVLLLIAFGMPSFAESFDFSQKGNEGSNAILKEAILQEIEGFHGDVVSYFYDIDNDNKDEIIGIVKSKLYYTLAGFNLVVLKQDENGWGIMNTNIYFDDSMPFNISGRKISYHKTVFYKHKKAYATLNKDNNYRAAVSIKDYYTNKKVKAIEEAIDITKGHSSVEVDVNDFPSSEQGTFVISYPEGYEKPKYHFELH